MNLTQRFQRYFVGVVIGLILVFVFFGERSCTDWLPNDRVLDRLSETDMIITKKARCEMNCAGLVDEDLLHLLRTGNVEFNQSQTRTYPLVYYVEASRESDDYDYAMKFEARDSTTTLIDVLTDKSGTCLCE